MSTRTKTKTSRKQVSIDKIAKAISFDEEPRKPPAPPPSPLTVIEETITPEIAKIYLEKNFASNRNVLKNYVARYAGDIRAGRWRFEASDPIRFNTDGQLIDGQHRLHAVISTGIPVRFLVIRGIPTDAVHVIDTGKSRSPADALRISGHVNTALLAASLRNLLIIKDGPLRIKTPQWHSHSDILDANNRHPDMKQWAGRVRPIRGVRPSQVVALSYIGDKLLGLPDTAHRFITVFNTGIPDYEGCPAQRLREQLIASSGHKGARASNTWSLMMMAHVWNMFAKRKPSQVLKSPTQATIDGLDSDLI